MTINWEKFGDLSGASDRNFELLCRGLVRINYGQYGQFVSYSNMAGIEFYIDLEKDCPLGNKDVCIGWQCKWYEIQQGRAIGTTRRNQIQDAILKTEKYHDNITDWVLWTKHTLTEGDQKWFRGIESRLRLHLYDSEDIETLAKGSATAFFNSYFGNLALDLSSLSYLNEISFSPIAPRWNPEVHQLVDIEREARKHLGNPMSWEVFNKLSNELLTYSDHILKKLEDYAERTDLLDDTVLLIVKSIGLSEHLKNCYSKLESNEFEISFLEIKKFELTENNRVLCRLYRKKSDVLGLYVNNLLSFHQSALNQLENLREFLEQRIVVVSAEAGVGKTEFAASIASESLNTISGVILHGKNLTRNSSLNSLVSSFSINGDSVLTFERLSLALSSIAERHGKKVAIVIDGLNESEDPRMWKDILREVNTMLKKLNNVIVFATVRPAYLKESVHKEFQVIESEGFGKDLDDAIEKYFEYYKINAVPGVLPMDMLSHPLNLRLFCETVNPSRAGWIELDSAPQSLMSLFEIHLRNSAERIAELSHFDHRIYSSDVTIALNKFGNYLWENNVRSLPQEQFRNIISDQNRPWGHSLLALMESGGLLIRSKFGNEDHVYPIFDAFAGFLMADSILRSVGSVQFENWVKSEENRELLFGDHTKSHTYSEDIINAFVALTPNKIYGRNFWSYFDGEEKEKLVLKCMEIEKRYLDSETLAELENIFLLGKANKRSWLRLYYIKGLRNHPLNVKWTDKILSSLSISVRDSSWTEWVKEQKKGFVGVIEDLNEHLLSDEPKVSVSTFIYFKWLLTSNDREIRDRTSELFYNLGIKYPELLFKITIKSLSLDDDYISSRLISICFGVITSLNYCVQNDVDITVNFLFKINENLIGDEAKKPNDNYIIRHYVKHIVEYLRNDDNFSNLDTIKDFSFNFKPEPEVERINIDDPRRVDLRYSIQMDFENYTLGRLFRDRRNYDNKHVGHKDCVSYVYGLLYKFGWRADNELGIIDKRIGNQIQRHNRAKTERYGKKYSWIGFYKYAGILASKGLLKEDRITLLSEEIDPSFPLEMKFDELDLVKWNIASSKDDRKWMEKEEILLPEDLLRRKNLKGKGKYWVLISAYLSLSDEITDRNIFGFVTTLLFAKSSTPNVITKFNSGYPGDVARRENVELYGITSGEIPWAKSFLDVMDEVESYESDEHGENLTCEYRNDGLEKWLKSAGIYYFPVRKMIQNCNLKKKLNSLEFINENGEVVSTSIKAPEGYNGDLFYVREDILMRYKGNRDAVTFCWGEKEIRKSRYEIEEWQRELARSYKNIWRQVIKR